MGSGRRYLCSTRTCHQKNKAVTGMMTITTLTESPADASVP